MSAGIHSSERSVKGKPLPEDFDSRRSRLQVAMLKDPPHLNIFELSGITAIASTAGNGYYAQETLFSIKHGLGYRPKVFVYFYGLSNNSYAVGTYFYGYGTADDYITYRADDETLEILHIVDGYGLTEYTSLAPSGGKIRLKYMICSNPVNKLMVEM
jgi:hypothetical protein